MTETKALANISRELDSFDAADGDERAGVIKGTKAKFSKDSEWLTAGDEPMPPGVYLVINFIKITQKWPPNAGGERISAPPLETIFIGADEKFPDVARWNEEAPRSEWRNKFGKMVGPWEKAYVVYLVHEKTKRVFTYLANTDGGHRAVRDLRESVRIARKAEGAPVLPIVTLADTHMPTQFGGRQRPHFEIRDYKIIGATDRDPRQIQHHRDGGEDNGEDGSPLEEIKELRPGETEDAGHHARLTKRGVQQIGKRTDRGPRMSELDDDLPDDLK